MKSILIVEDDPDIAAIERDYLANSGFATEWAVDGPRGLDMALKGDYALVLLDVMLPGIDGFAVCRLLREQRDVPILLVTARHEDADKIKGLGLGADDYVVKPFSPRELVARVMANIAQYERLKGQNGRQDQTETGWIVTGEVKIQPATRRVWIRDQEIELKNREFELFHYLVSHESLISARNAVRPNLGQRSLG